MKILLWLMACMLCRAAYSNTYHFSESTGDDARTSQQAQNSLTPWRSLTKLNSIMADLQPGDSILFKRGDTFAGSILVTVSGSAAHPIAFSVYGTGNRPVITGFTTVSGWMPSSNGIWEAVISTPSINILLTDGRVLPKGRYPNAGASNQGFLVIDNASGNQFTDNQLTGNPNWTGATAVIRKNRWVLDADPITQHAGNTIQVTNTSGYTPANGYGYFIQDHMLTLDQPNEWFFDRQLKKLYYFFSSAGPPGLQVQVSSGEQLVNIVNKDHLHFSDIRFEGANTNAFQLHNAQHIQITNCDIAYTGINSIQAGGSNGLRVESCTIQYANNIALNMNSCSNAVIAGNSIGHTGTFAGMGQNNSGSYEAIILNGNNNRVEYNNIDSTGYIPITFGGNSVTIRNNSISHFAFIKDDGGGIYTWNNQQNAPRNHDRSITGNIVLHGIGAGQGTDDPGSARAHGIYIDDNSSDINITGNTLAHCGQYGIFIHNSHDLVIHNNTAFDNASQLVITHDNTAPDAPVRNLRVTSNILFAKQPWQLAAEFKTIRNDLDNFGFFDSNYYSRPLDDNMVIFRSYRVDGNYRNDVIDLETWQALHHKDLHSVKSPVPIASYRLNSLTGGNKYPNGSFNNDIGGLYAYSSANNVAASWTSSAGLDNGALQVLFTSQTQSYNQAYVVIGVGALIAGRNYILRFSMRGTNEYRNMQAFLRQSQSPYNDLSARKVRRITGARSGHEFLLTATASENDASIVLELGEQPDPVYFDNIQLYESNATITNPDDSIRFEYNATNFSRTLALGGIYIDPRKIIYTNTITLTPYTSAVLIKKLTPWALPVQFITFRGSRANGRVKLNWTVSPDASPGLYEVERSGTGSNFEKIGRIAVVPRQAAYQFMDPQPLPGDNYYRLRYISGSNELYSNILLVRENRLNALPDLRDEDMILRPNPATSRMQVFINALPVLLPVSLMILTVTGSLVKSFPVYLANNQVILDISFLPPGQYFLRFTCNGKVLTRPFIKVR